jgi:hypothetical protein
LDYVGNACQIIAGNSEIGAHFGDERIEIATGRTGEIIGGTTVRLKFTLILNSF